MIGAKVRALLQPVPRDHRQPDAEFEKRRYVALITLVVGAAVLAISLRIKAGSEAFYPLTLLLAVVWTVGGLASGPLHLGRGPGLRRPVLVPFLLGVLAAWIFILGALVVREIGPLHDYVARLLEHAAKGSIGLILLVTVLNGIAEEIYFRGALYAAIGRRHAVLISTIVYALATVTTGNPMLVFAAATLGTVWALQRRASGGLLASAITHVTWSVIMLFALPPLFGVH